MDWEPKLIEIEEQFDRFIPTFRGGVRVTEAVDQKIGTLNADYFFSTDNLIIELKTLTKDQSDPYDFTKRLAETMRDSGYSGSDTLGILFRGEPIPHDVGLKLASKMQNAMRNAVRKANRQIEKTKTLLGRPKANGLLIVANDQDFGFSPLEYIATLSQIALKLSNCHIDGIVYTSPNVFYDDGTDTAKQYWIPVYADGKEHLANFVNPFGQAWLDFFETVSEENFGRWESDELPQHANKLKPIKKFKKPSKKP